MRFSHREIVDLLKAYAALSLAFTFLLYRSLGWETAAIVALVTFGAGFLVHELAHKLTAQHFNCFAEFRSSDLWLVLAIVLAWAGGIIFAAPGAVVISNVASKRQYGIIALAGPVSNIVLALVFLALPLGVISQYGFYINALLALFNMLPFGPLDGKKVLGWDKRAFWATIIVSAVLFVIAIVM